jgi:hypothetical protein
MSLNEDQSPFLRLPGEIRNKIYAPVLGGLIIESKGSARPICKSDAKVHRSLVQVRATESNDISLTLSGLLQLLNVCRQIRMETRLLPFGLNEFQIRPSHLKYFLHGLTKAQRGAISALRIDECVVHHISLSIDELYPPMSPIDAGWCPCLDTDWRGLRSLRRMTGLKRVILQECPSWAIGEVDRARKDIAISWIHKWVDRRDIEVVVEEIEWTGGWWYHHPVYLEESMAAHVPGFLSLSNFGQGREGQAGQALIMRRSVVLSCDTLGTRQIEIVFE